MKDADWKILVTLYENKSLTKAAEALFMTQSALTKKVHAIENEWGIELVKRSSQGVLFTEDGKYLVKKAEIMLDFLKEIEEHFQGYKKKDLLRIGVPNSFARIHMPKLLMTYLKKYNHLQIQSIPNTSDHILRQLTNGSIDMGIVCGDFTYLGEKVCLMDEEMYMVVPKGMKFEDIVHHTLIESNYNPVVKLMVNQWWQSQFGEIPHGSYSVPYTDIALEMVESGIGVTFIFGSNWKVNEEKLQKIPVYDSKGNIVSRRVWLMMNDKCFQSEAITEFISFVEEYYGVNVIDDSRAKIKQE